MITLAEAQQRLKTSVTCRLPTETVDLSAGLGRVASGEIQSALAIPPCDNSAMDGFALFSADISDPGTQLKVSQRIPAGVEPVTLTPGTAARIFTGGMMPKGADAVVIQENCEFNDSCVTINTAVKSGDNVRPKGQDIQSGATVVLPGKRLSAIDLSLIASIGQAHVDVYRPLKVAIFSTGDELIAPGKALKPGQIYNSNRPLLIALCTQLGYKPIDCGIVEDSLEATKIALERAAGQADIILSSGGVSVGEEDHVKPAVDALGSLQLWKVRMKPGKPVAFGDVLGTPFLGLPGNPVSSYVVFQLLGVPLMRTLQGQLFSPPPAYPVLSDFDKKWSTREEYIRVRIEKNNQGQLVAQRFNNLSSGVMSSLSWADGLVRQDMDTAISEGQSVMFLPFNEGML